MDEVSEGVNIDREMFHFSTVKDLLSDSISPSWRHLLAQIVAAVSTGTGFIVAQLTYFLEARGLRV